MPKEPKQVSVTFDTQKGEAIATYYKFEKNNKWYFGVHHLWTDDKGEAHIGKGFAIETGGELAMLDAIIRAVNEATGSHWELGGTT